MRPDDVISACHGAHQRLIESAAALSESDVRAPSALENWSRAHVLAHLARNAESHAYLFEGALRGEVRVQYPRAGMREADIERTAALSLEELLGDLERSCRALEEAWDSLEETQWSRLGQTARESLPMVEFVFRRLREVEVHHVDLAANYGPSNWCETYVSGELTRSLAWLDQRTDPRELILWLIGRAPAPTLSAW